MQSTSSGNSFRLTSGMSEEKATLLVRKFFGNSVIESKKSRMAQTETIAEENSEPEVTPPHPHLSKPEATSLPSELKRESTGLVADVKPEADRLDEDVKPEVGGSAVDVKPEVDGLRADLKLEGLIDSLDSDELFRLCGISDFGSSQDALDIDDVDDDGSMSFRTTTSTLRYSSCSERSVRLSDIINRPDPPSASAPTASASELRMTIPEVASEAAPEAAPVAVTRRKKLLTASAKTPSTSSAASGAASSAASGRNLPRPALPSPMKPSARPKTNRSCNKSTTSTTSTTSATSGTLTP